MAVTTLSGRRVAIFEDNSTNRERLSDMVTRCGGVAVPVGGPAPRLSVLRSYFKSERIHNAIFDHHLSHHGDYADYYGAQGVAESYRSGVGAILVTAFEASDAELSLRRYRRQIPALIRSPEDLDRKNLQAALLLADSEVRGKHPPRERIPHRTIMTVKRIESLGSIDVVKVVMSQWNASQEIGFPMDLIPARFRAAVMPGKFLIAEVNIEAARQEDLFFDNFELPNDDVLKKTKTLFGRP
jgi:hypothetical protein